MADTLDNAEREQPTPETQRVNPKRPPRIQLTEEEVIKRMNSFDERKEEYLAAVRKNKD